MRKVQLTLEIVTPLFLGGADQQPELRPASIRGTLRFWLRAALGGVMGDDNLQALHHREAEVFGKTECGSTVGVRITEGQITKGREPLLPHHNSANAPAIRTGSFDLHLTLRPGAQASALEIATWCVLLWLTLGGSGRRSRRGEGSLRIKTLVAVPDMFSDDLKGCLNAATMTDADGQALANRVGDLLNKARHAIETFAQVPPPRFSAALPCFSILRPDTRIVIWTPPNTDLKDYKTVLTPLMKQLSSRMAANPSAYQDGFGGIKPSRRASPLLVTAHRLEKEWALTLTHLKAEIRNGVAGKPAEVTAFLDGLVPKWEVSLLTMQGGVAS